MHMEGMLEQSRISEKNVRYLRSLAASPTADVAEWATVVLEIARIHPARRHRLPHLKRLPDLWARMHRLGIVEDFHDELADAAHQWPDDEPFLD